MEDRYVAVQGTLNLKNDSQVPFELFGVFDGHVGTGASEYTQKNLTKYLTEALISEPDNASELTQDGIFKALKACFINLGNDYPGKKDGTTATVVLLLKDKIWVANVGNSRTVLIKMGKATQASQDATLDISRFYTKIIKLGGQVIKTDTLRINGDLAIARAIGDKYLTDASGKVCVVSSKPKITSYLIKDFQGGHILLATNSFFRVTTTNETGSAFYDMESFPKIKNKMAELLVTNALGRSAKKNVTAMVVKIR